MQIQTQHCQFKILQISQYYNMELLPQEKQFMKILIQDYWYHKKYNTLITCIIQEFSH